MNTRISATLFALTLTFTATMATAQGGYPSQPIRLLVGFPPGGSTDILARALANEVRTALNQEVVVITQAGASGAISVAEVVTAKPDGYTLGINPSSAFTLAFHFMDTRPDLIPPCSEGRSSPAPCPQPALRNRCRTGHCAR